MSSQQLYRDEQNRGDLPQADANASPLQNELGHGTDVMGEPVNPLHEPAGAAAVSHEPAGATMVSHEPANPPSAGTRDPPVSPVADSRAPSNVPNASAGNFPTAQMPQTLSMRGDQTTASQQPPAAQAGSPSPYVQAPSPYVQTSSVPGSTGKTPMDSIMQVFNKWSKKAEDMTGNVWTHLRTGPNVADTALGRLAVGTKAMSEGGIENVYRQTFEVAPEERLLKTYACYLSTSTGPVAGTLYISSQKLAFCSDRPLAMPAPQQTGGDATTDRPATNAASTASKKSSSAQQQQQQQQQQQHCYYKVMIPISQVESVNPSENTQKKQPEKYVQVKTSDGHEFWFMGFVNYDKGVKNLQETLLSKNANPSPTTNTATEHVSQAGSV